MNECAYPLFDIIIDDFVSSVCWILGSLGILTWLFLVIVPNKIIILINLYHLWIINNHNK